MLTSRASIAGERFGISRAVVPASFGDAIGQMESAPTPRYDLSHCSEDAPISWRIFNLVMTSGCSTYAQYEQRLAAGL
ncbi:hypothetical protein C7476_108128 [Phyllobacterium bourgognense]|uniref:Uncharacterized protein n=1 Tax=Phyllobacterium bourgognense TaxID=314236 RepID=A0A368YVU0_9HYPH|nr:hypothetical protein C7476_108128 [Phyllobacterium bourgognense]